MRSRRLDRRTVLRGAMGTAIALPWLEIMGCKGGESGTYGATAQRLSGPPKRFIVMYTPNGNVRKSWLPTGAEANFTLSPILAPLEPFKQQLLVLDGLELVASAAGPGDPHQRGMAFLTGEQLSPGNQVGNDGVSLAGYANGISVDQQIAKKVGGTTKFKSLEFGVQLGGADVMHRMSYLDANQPLPPDEDPSSAFDRIFSELGDGGFVSPAVRKHRATVLDAVAADYSRLSPRLGAADSAKIDQHLSSIRDLEKRLDQGALTSGSCVPGTAPGRIDLANHDNMPAIGKLQMDLLVMALTCDLTRVASLEWCGARNKHTFNWLDIADEHHSLSHSGESDTDSQEKLQAVHTWYSKQFAYLLGRLRATPEGDGTLLDSTVILWATEVAVGNSHAPSPLPWLLAGSAQKHFRTGRFLTFPDGTSHNNLLVSLLNAMDIDTNTFGKATACTGPLSGLT